jgi:hypothetical protein
MDRSAVKSVVERELEPLMMRLGIPHWHVVVGYKPEADDGDFVVYGRCARRSEYNAASITLNPETLDGAEEVLDSLRHELLHVVLAPFDLYRKAVGPLLSGDEARAEVFEVLFRHCVEQAVVCLNRMYVGLSHRPKKLKAKRKR